MLVQYMSDRGCSECGRRFIKMTSILRAPTSCLMPFLYPFTSTELRSATRFANRYITYQGRHKQRNYNTIPARSNEQQAVRTPSGIREPSVETSSADTVSPSAHLNPPPDSYTQTPFLDSCTVTVSGGSGGNGCVSFLREKFIEEGPANGGDGGSGGNIWIQAVRTETSLHKVARRRAIKAGSGKNGMGSSMGGRRGEDVIVEVPVGTVVREVERIDPLAKDEEIWLEAQRRRKNRAILPEEEWETARGDKWVVFPGTKPWAITASDIPDLPKPRRSSIAAMMPRPPIRLDLDESMQRPMLLVAGALGGHGNTHFVSNDSPRPKFATKGDGGMSITLHLELKLLADVGLVGLPNAGKSTLLRALSNSKTRVGNWAFTTLQPNIGTVVLDDYKSRPRLRPLDSKGEYRTKFTIADIPGLIEDAHLNKGLGLDFLRHVERAAVLAFVIDLNAGDAVQALKALWKEVAEYDVLRRRQANLDSETKIVEWTPIMDISSMPGVNGESDDQVNQHDGTKSKRLPPLVFPPISSKPWFVVGTKADLPDTQANFSALQTYLQGVEQGVLEHPSGIKHAWKKHLDAVPVSGIRGEGVDRIPELVIDLLNG